MKPMIITLILLMTIVLPAMGAPTDTIGPRVADASAFQNLSTALASPSTENKTVVVSEPMDINNKTTDRAIKIEKGGSINVARDKSLKVTGPFSAPLGQCFSGAGNVEFSGGRTIYNEWSGLSNNFAPVYLSNTTEAGKLGDEIITNGAFASSATSWTLANFTHSSGISHAAGTVGIASQAITLQAYTTGLLTVSGTTTVAGFIDFGFNGASLMDDTIAKGNGSYYFGVGPFEVELAANMITATTTARLSITTDKKWAGTLANISLKPVIPMPFTISQQANDDLTGRIPQGIKFGRFNAGNIAIGDKETLSGIDFGPFGAWNIAIGARSQTINRTGFESTSVGAFALKNNNAPRNTAYGYSAGKLNTTGINLTAIGYKSLIFNSTGNRNTGLGFHSAMQNSIGNDNTAIGYQALYSLTTNSFNTAIGSQSAMNTAGTENTFVGALSGYLNDNVNVRYPYDYTTSIGAESKAYGDNGTALGWQAQVGANNSPVTNSTAIGSAANVTTSNTVQLGNTSVTRFGFGAHSIFWGTEPPTKGTWAQGDRGFNTSATIGHPKGWVCTVGGTPGTWVSEGNL